MKTERDPWVRVRDVKELHRGCAFKVTACKRCGGTHLGTVMDDGSERVVRTASGKSVRLFVLDTSAWCDGLPLGIPEFIVAKGNVWRLRPDASTDTATTERARERVTVK